MGGHGCLLKSVAKKYGAIELQVRLGVMPPCNRTTCERRRSDEKTMLSASLSQHAVMYLAGARDECWRGRHVADDFRLSSTAVIW